MYEALETVSNSQSHYIIRRSIILHGLFLQHIYFINIPHTKQHYEMTEPTLAAHEETYTYWEPADTVNDLHKQLSSNKYRELLPEQVK